MIFNDILLKNSETTFKVIVSILCELQQCFYLALITIETKAGCESEFMSEAQKHKA